MSRPIPAALMADQTRASLALTAAENALAACPSWRWIRRGRLELAVIHARNDRTDSRIAISDYRRSQ